MGYETSEQDEPSIPPLTGMSIFALAAGKTPQIPSKGTTRACSGANIPRPMEFSSKADPFAGGWRPKPKIKLDANEQSKPVYHKELIPIIAMPENCDLGQLSSWHQEREGHEPSPDSQTPVWIKLDTASWAIADKETWSQLFTPLLNEIERLKYEIDGRRARFLQGWVSPDLH